MIEQDKDKINAYYGIIVLVNHIKNNKPSEPIDSMTYKEFSGKINELNKNSPSNHRNMSGVLNNIGDFLLEFDSDSPRITILIVLAERYRPGDGFRYEKFNELSPLKQDKIIKEQKESIKKYLREGNLDKFLLEKVPAHYRAAMPTHEDDNFEVMEGVTVKKHREFEDNRRSDIIVIQKKRQSKYICECCGFDFYKTYGELGKEYIECHHIKPLAEFDKKGEKIGLEDLAVLCANCHRMIHLLLIRNKKEYKDNYHLSMDDLRDVMKKQETNP